jgi:hypothetical protein
VSSVRPRLVPVLLSTALAAPLAACGSSGPTLTVSDLPAGAVIGAQRATDFVVHVNVHGGSARKVKADVDGQPASTAVQADGVTVTAHDLAAGKHKLVVRASGSSVTRAFVVDTTPPTLKVNVPATAPSLRTPVTLTGVATGAVKVSVGGRDVPVATDGTFRLTLPTPPSHLAVAATDSAGNVATQAVTVAVRHPLMRGVHLTGYGWNADVLRKPVLALARAHKINTIELDIKEEDGFVNFDTSVALAHQIHAVRVLYDPRKVIPQLHKLGIRVVGRIVCFRDPKLAGWAWKHGHHAWVVQSPKGGPYNSAKYGGAAFTNWADPQVQAYNIALATEAAKLGFDDVMYDYVRRPDGPLSTMRFVGAKVTAPVGVANFVRDTAGPVRSNGAYLGLAVFGVSATRPKEVGQDISAMARYVDYVAPMVYPSHWGPGEYGVANPNAQPYAIVNRSLKDFLKKVKGTNAQVMPWLQDFSLGVTYDVGHVKAQILAAARDGIGSLLLWNAGCTYHGDAFAVDPSLPKTTD